MTRRKRSLPENISPYVCHGVYLEQSTSNNWVGTCPFCAKEEHFYVSQKTGQYDCKVCGETGNVVTFLTTLADECYSAITKRKIKKLIEDRSKTTIKNRDYSIKIPQSAFSAYQIGFNPGTSEFTIPCFSEKGTVRDIRRYKPGNPVKSTAGCKSQLGGIDHVVKSNKTARVWVAEGEWDAVFLAYLFRLAGLRSDVVAWVPGANTFKKEFLSPLKGRHVVLCYDNDKAGDDGSVRAYELCKKTCKKVEAVCWPEELPSGYDARDFVISQLETVKTPKKVVENLEALIESKPRRATVTDEEQDDEPEEDDNLKPISFPRLLRTFEEHILMDDQMADALKIMCAVILSTPLENDPLWLYIVGPAGCGKTTLLASFQDSYRCRFVSKITSHGLVSGWRGEGTGDPSLIPQLKNKTLIAKDFTEILTMGIQEQDELYSTLRGAYDGHVDRQFGNGVKRSYRGCYFTLICGVTNAIHGHARASLGERFLKYQINNVDRDHANSVVRAAIMNVGQEKKMEENLKLAMRRFLKGKKSIKKLPRMSRQYVRRLISLVNLIALMRAQVERDQRTDELLYRPAPESGTRLAKQLAKLARVLCIVEKKKEVDEDIFRLIRKVAYDTAHHLHLNIVEVIMKLGGSATKQDISIMTGLPITTLSRRMEDLVVLKAIKRTKDKKTSNIGGRPSHLYQVVDDVAALWLRVCGKSSDG